MPLYLALGDSMSIDDYAGGPGRGPASLLAGDLGMDLRLLARDGATTAKVLAEQLPQITRTPDLVTITMGGNDLLSVYGDTAAARSAIGDIRGRYGAILSHLRTLMSEAPIVLTTVYDPSDGTGITDPDGPPPWPDGVAVIAELNEVIRQAASEFGTLLADVHAAFLGHGSRAGLVSQSDPEPANRDLWYCGVVEPNAYGAQVIHDTWREVLDKGGNGGG